MDQTAPVLKDLMSLCPPPVKGAKRRTQTTCQIAALRSAEPEVVIEWGL